MTRDRPSADRPLPERLPLGAASRLLGVDPDTLRRWADEGRVPAFTTPGGHRRFEREALERLILSRRTGPDGGLAGAASTPDRLSAAYRRRYADLHPKGGDPRGGVPDSERETFRDTGRRLVDALVRHLEETGQARALAERDAIDLAAELGERLALQRMPLADAISMFVSARRPFLAELSVVARRRASDAPRIGDLFDSSTWLMDRLLLAFVAGHDVVSREATSAGPGVARAAGAAGTPRPAMTSAADGAGAPDAASASTGVESNGRSSGGGAAAAGASSGTGAAPDAVPGTGRSRRSPR